MWKIHPWCEIFDTTTLISNTCIVDRSFMFFIYLFTQTRFVYSYMLLRNPIYIHCGAICYRNNGEHLRHVAHFLHLFSYIVESQWTWQSLKVRNVQQIRYIFCFLITTKILANNSKTVIPLTILDGRPNNTWPQNRYTYPYVCHIYG